MNSHPDSSHDPENEYPEDWETPECLKDLDTFINWLCTNHEEDKLTKE